MYKAQTAKGESVKSVLE